jgi:uncharacterized phosphosugar-binding protein
MDGPERYFTSLIELLSRLRVSQRAAVSSAAEAISASLARGGFVHLFGTGHSHLLAEEVFYRAGGLVAVQAMLDPRILLSAGARRSTEAERTTGMAVEIGAQYDLRAGDVGIVISNSGRNPAPIEMAQLMKSRGLTVIALTNLAHSRSHPALPPHSLRLFELADVVLDNGGAIGDAAISLPGVKHPVGPTSTIAGAALLHAVMIEVMERLVAAGERVVNLPSGNVDGADLTGLAEEIERCRGRLRHW